MIRTANKTWQERHQHVSSFPENLFLAVPEVHGVIQKGMDFTFGGTFLASNAEHPTEFLIFLVAGLAELGQNGVARRTGLGGNFLVHGVWDDVTGACVEGQLLTPLSTEFLQSQYAKCLVEETLTIEFFSPLRITRPRSQQTEQSQTLCLNQNWFHAPMMVRSIVDRLKKKLRIASFAAHETNQTIVDDDVQEVLESRHLQWQPFFRSGKNEDLGGVTGSVKLRVKNPLAIQALVFGQYAHAGKNSAFGHGRYRIVELGQDRMPSQTVVHPRASITPHERVLEPNRHQLPTSEIASFAVQNGIAMVFRSFPRLSFENDTLLFTDESETAKIEVRSIKVLIICGNGFLPAPVIHRLLQMNVSVIHMDDQGQCSELTIETVVDAEIIDAQLKLSHDKFRSGRIAASIVEGRIYNYSRTADDVQPSTSLGSPLREIAGKVCVAEKEDAVRALNISAVTFWDHSVRANLMKRLQAQLPDMPEVDVLVDSMRNTSFTLACHLSSLAIKSASLLSSFGFLNEEHLHFAPLIVDLALPFHFLFDKAVVEAINGLESFEFACRENSSTAQALADMQIFLRKSLWKNLHQQCRTNTGREEPRSYLVHLQRQAHDLRKHLLQPETPFTVFRLP